MRYTVIWTDPAEQDLAALWMAAPDRKAVTSAAHILDQLLAEVCIMDWEIVRRGPSPPHGLRGSATVK
jgi:plasmid stabilization system protein ParE